MKIHLKDLKFYSFHGLHNGEDILGGKFEVNLTVSFEPGHEVLTKIDKTVDYSELYRLVKDRMAIKTPLLETIGMEIANEIIAQFHIVSEVEISIQKLHPPIEQFEGSVGISYKLTR